MNGLIGFPVIFVIWASKCFHRGGRNQWNVYEIIITKHLSFEKGRAVRSPSDRPELRHWYISKIPPNFAFPAHNPLFSSRFLQGFLCLKLSSCWHMDYSRAAFHAWTSKHLASWSISVLNVRTACNRVIRNDFWMHICCDAAVALHIALTQTHPNIPTLNFATLHPLNAASFFLGTFFYVYRLPLYTQIWIYTLVPHWPVLFLQPVAQTSICLTVMDNW